MLYRTRYLSNGKDEGCTNKRVFKNGCLCVCVCGDFPIFIGLRTLDRELGCFLLDFAVFLLIMTSLNGQRYFSEKIDLNARRCAPISSLIALVLGIALIDLPLTVLDLRDEVNSDDYLRIMGIAQCSLKMLSFVLLLVHAGHRCWNYKCQLLSTFETNSSCHWLQIMFCSLYTAGVILHLFSHTLWTHSSDHDAELDSTGILSEISVFSFPVMLAPLLLGAVFADALREVIWLWWALCLLSLVSVAVLTQSIAYGLVVLYYFFQSGIIFYALRQNALLQLLKQQLQESQQEATLREQDLNLKHMMANVAHDLKTVRSNLCLFLTCLILLSAAVVIHGRGAGADRSHG